MKKLFLLFALVSICSCDPVTTEERNDSQMCGFDRIRHFTYKGHKYISFENIFPANQSTVGIVHDPNCSCHKL